MDFLGGLFALLKAAIPPALAMVPEHWKRDARARFDDINPFHRIRTNHDLIRALRIAWVEAAFQIFDEVLRCIDTPEWAAERSEAGRVESCLRTNLLRERSGWFDRDADVGQSPIDTHLHTVLYGIPEFVLPRGPERFSDPITDNFPAILAHFSSPLTGPIPGVFGHVAGMGIAAKGGGPLRPFGELVFAAFAELIKNPNKYPQAKAGFDIAMAAMARELAEGSLAAIKGVDEKIDRVLDRMSADKLLLAGIARQLGALSNIIDTIRADQAEDAGIFPIRDATISTEVNPHRVTDLLLARARAIPFVDFDGRLVRLVEWARPPIGATAPRTIGALLYVGEGGVGKTRLALALADILRDEGWETRRIAFGHEPNAAWRAVLAPGMEGDGPTGILVVVDYAESRPRALANLARKVAEVRGIPGPHLRILALARSGGWWKDARREDGMTIFAEPIRIDFRTAAMTAEERRDFYSSAEASFRGILAPLGLAGGPTAPPHLDAEAYDRPLAIAAAAFLGARGIASDDGTNLYDDLLAEERLHWERIVADPSNHGPIEALRRASAQLTLVQGASEAEARHLLMADRHFDRTHGEHLDTIIARLRALYPGDPASGHAIGPIEPDLLGEAAFAAVANDAARDGARLMEVTVTACLANAVAADAVRSARNAIEVMRRAAHHPNADTRTATRGVIRRLEIWAQHASADHLSRLEKALPWETVELRPLAAVAALRLFQATQQSSDADVSKRSLKARRLLVLGIRLSDLGRREEALTASEEAVALFRELVAANGDAFLSGLAGALDNLGNYLSNLGRREAALTATEEAVVRFRQLVAANRAAFLPDLAGALSNLGIRISILGRREEALTASEEAVAIRRELVVANRGAFLPDLAGALNNLGAHLSNLGRHEAALTASEEASALYRELVATNRDAFLPDLAGALGNLGIRLSRLGHREAALTANEEAVAVYRELVVANRDTFLSDLARALTNLGIRLSNLDRREAALTASDEAVALYRELVTANRDAFLPDLARALNGLGIRLSNLGGREAALTASEEAVALYRELVAGNRDAFLPDLASALNNLGIRLSNLGRREAALTASDEAVALYRELVAANRDAFLPDLAVTLSARGDILVRTGLTEEAIEFYREAAGALRQYYEALPAAHSDLWRANLCDFARAMKAAGRSRQQIEAALRDVGWTPNQGWPDD